MAPHSKYSCLENPMERGAWQAPVHGVTKSWTRLHFHFHFHFSLACIGEGNGNPLQCSCLENPRDGGAWWAAIYGVAQSRTRLKRLSSSSSGICYSTIQTVSNDLITLEIFIKKNDKHDKGTFPTYILNCVEYPKYCNSHFIQYVVY